MENEKTICIITNTLLKQGEYRWNDPQTFEKILVTNTHEKPLKFLSIINVIFLSKYCVIR